MKSFFLSFIIKLYLNIVLLTCEWNVRGARYLNDEIKKQNPIMLCCWHERLIYFVCFFKKWKNKIWVISSTHRDSEILAKVLSSWQFGLIKGSSTRGWFSVIRGLSDLFEKRGSVVAITNDGPRGPRKEAKEGALKVAIKKNVSIIGMSATASSFWTLKTWDKIKIPKPFSIIYLSFYSKYSKGFCLKEFNLYLNNNQNEIDSHV